ncbi:ABC transporter permease [Thiobacillus sp.]|uniref:ABC transporter permease n=1 Tax=Thiobacillus sp. TaxID=924 RepID=UPI0025F39776|nr:ABC transporter permease [Thiobacillus sp.]
MSFARLGLWLLRRERASGEWRVLLLALIIGVGSVSTTGFLGDRLKRAMSEQGASFLGADLLVTSPRPIEDWPVLAVTKSAGTARALARSQALEFPSMLAKGDAFQLATLRAVDAAYPLRGSVRIADRPFATGTARPAQPPPGMIYVAPDLLPLLSAKVGDRVQIGEARFTIAGIVAEEPGQLGGVFGLAPRVFMRADEVAKTRVLQPGSRVTYLYQFAGDPAQLTAFSAALKSRLDSTQRLIGSREGVETLRGAFANADRYIQLTALISLLLSVAAIAIAAHRHALRHYDQAALLRDRRADAAGAGAAGSARCRHPPAVAWVRARGRCRLQRPAGIGGRQPARVDAPRSRTAAAGAAARSAAVAGRRMAQRGDQRLGAAAADRLVCGQRQADRRVRRRTGRVDRRAVPASAPGAGSRPRCPENEPRPGTLRTRPVAAPPFRQHPAARRLHPGPVSRGAAGTGAQRSHCRLAPAIAAGRAQLLPD